MNSNSLIVSLTRKHSGIAAVFSATIGRYIKVIA